MLAPNPKNVLVPNPNPFVGIAEAEPRAARKVPKIELWDAWVFAEVDSALALRRWFDAPEEDKAVAFAAYGASVDREERAALALAERLRS